MIRLRNLERNYPLGHGKFFYVLRDIDILQNTMNQLRGCGLIPRGVYRFRTHEEADEWMMRQIAANHARHASKTS